jgi:hypothetical protein
MYKSALVPRGMAMLGLISGPLAVASATAVLFGLYKQTRRRPNCWLRSGGPSTGWP